MKLIADTNVLVRVLTRDDALQAQAAEAALRQADLIAIPTPVLCELVWVLTRGYDASRAEIAAAIRGLMNSAAVSADRPAVAAGLALLEAGGDFADGVIAHEGQALGGEVFNSFDRQALQQLAALGAATREPT